MAKKNYDRDLVQKAVLKWRGYDKRSSMTHSDFYDFAKFIGYPHTSTIKIVDTDKPEVQNIIDMINGPNGYAIIKMIEARNTPEEDPC